MPTLLDPNSILTALYGNGAGLQQQGDLSSILRGQFNPSAYLAANPRITDAYNTDPSYGGFYGSLDNFAQADWKSNGSPQGFNVAGTGLLDLNSAATQSAAADQIAANTAQRTANVNDLSTLGPQARAAWAAANPTYAAYTDQLGNQLNQINSRGTPLAQAGLLGAAAQAGVTDASTRDANAYTAQFNGANAAQAQFNAAAAARARASTAGTAYAGLQQADNGRARYTGAQAAQAGFSGANGGPLLGGITRDAAANLGQVSPLQQQLQQQAADQLGTNGGLSAQDLYNVQQDTRSAYAARGLYDSNQAIGSEIMNSDAARRQRLLQNQQAAQSIDASGQQQLAANRGYALNAQGQGQNLSTFNTGQSNQTAQYNAGLLSNASQFNAGQANALSQYNTGLAANTSTFNAGQANAQQQFNAGAFNQSALANAGLLTQNSQYNAGLQAQASQFNAGQANALGQFNANLLTNNSQFNASQANALGQYNAGLLTNNSQFNSGAFNTASLSNAQAANQAALANAQAQNQFALAQFGQNAATSQYNAGLQQQAGNDQFNRSLQYGGLLDAQSQQINGLIGTNSNAPQAGANLINQGLGSQQSNTDLISSIYNFNANAQNAAQIAAANNAAAQAAANTQSNGSIWGGALGAVGSLGGAAITAVAF